MNKRVKNTMLKTITIIAFSGWMFTSASLDSEYFGVLLGINILCLGWLLLMAVANSR